MKKVAVLKDNFETKTIKKMVNGKEVIETKPKFKKGQVFDIMEMNLFWMTPEEKGGIGVNLTVMDYMRLTYPDGTHTKYYDLFDIMDENQSRKQPEE